MGNLYNFMKKPRKKLKNVATEMGEKSKVVITDRKYKEKGSKGKRKIKYDKEGNIKKTVYKIKGKRIVDKPKRDNRKSMANKFRNILDNRFANGGIIQHD